MPDVDVADRDLAALVVPSVGRLVKTGEGFLPWRIEDARGEPIAPVDQYLRDLVAAGRATTTVRSYGMDLLRWFRFLYAVEVDWNRATRVEARDFSVWIQMITKPFGRSKSKDPGRTADRRGEPGTAAAGRYAASTVVHSETVLRLFYEFHREACTGPIMNPFPTSPRRRDRANAHHNPMELFRHERAGRYRPRVPKRVPRSIPDGVFNELFAGLPSNRDRAMVAFYVSSGARASELINMDEEDIDAGQQLISVVRKGAGARQQIPASPDTFVWLRLYQDELHGLVARGRRQPLWRIRRAPYSRLTYHGAHRMFERVNARLGSPWTLHALRHTAAYRMADDPDMPMTDVQWILGHRHLTTTQIYTNPRAEDVIARAAQHFAHQEQRRAQPAPPAPGYRPEALNVLFGRA